MYPKPTFKQFDNEAMQWLEFQAQAYALPTNERKRHAAVSTDNRHFCTNCFCCACDFVQRRIETQRRINL